MPKCEVCGKQLRSDRDVCPFCKAIIHQRETTNVQEKVREVPPANKKARELAFGYAALAILNIALNPLIAFFISNIFSWSWLSKSFGSPVTIVAGLLFPVIMNTMLAVAVWHVASLRRAGKTVLATGASVMAVMALLYIFNALYRLPAGRLPMNILIVNIVLLAIYTYLAAGVIRIVRRYNTDIQMPQQNGSTDAMRTSDTNQPYSPSYRVDDLHSDAEAKESRSATTLSEIGLAFAFIGIIAGSFIPLLDRIAFFLAVPAALISCAGLVTAFRQQARHVLASAAVAISLIGLGITGYEFFYTLQPQQRVKIIEIFQRVPAKISSTITRSKPESPQFTQYWMTKYPQLRHKEYEHFFSDTLAWPIDGYPFHFKKSKEAFLEECKREWEEYEWFNPEVKKDESKKTDVWTIKFSANSMEFEYTLIGDTYRLTGFYNIACEREVQERSTEINHGAGSN